MMINAIYQTEDQPHWWRGAVRASDRPDRRVGGSTARLRGMVSPGIEDEGASAATMAADAPDQFLLEGDPPHPATVGRGIDEAARSGGQVVHARVGIRPD